MRFLERLFGAPRSGLGAGGEPPIIKPNWDTPCDSTYGEYANSLSPCKRCGHLIGKHGKCAQKEFGISSRSMEDAAADFARAPHNPRTQLIRAGEQPGQTATELVAAAGASVPALAAAMTTIAARFEQSVTASHQLNAGLGAFREEVIRPLAEELKFLRYNLGDKVNQTTTNMEVMVSQLERTIWALLRADGKTDEQIRTWREERGMQPEAPTGPELESWVAERDGLLAQVSVLTAQNQRLLAQLTAKHVFWKEDRGEWAYHAGCNCDACRAETLHRSMGDEASGAARSRAAEPEKKPAKAKDRRKRRG